MEKVAVEVLDVEQYKRLAAYFDSFVLNMDPLRNDVNWFLIHKSNCEMRKDSFCLSIEKEFMGGPRSKFAAAGYEVITVDEFFQSIEKCLECKGTGLYVGFTTTEPCRACCGRRS